MLFKKRTTRKPVSVLTGFLGSGKTTVLQHLLAQADMSRTALIINEFGDVSIDHLLVETKEERMVLLANGCVCCSVRGDLVEAIHSLLARQQTGEIPPFDRILLETTGLASPMPIAQSMLSPTMANVPVYMDSIATTVDALHASANLAEHPELLAQIAIADTLLITKKDMVDDEQLRALETELRGLNQHAPIRAIEHGRAEPSDLFGQSWLDPDATGKSLRRAQSILDRYQGPEAHTGHSHSSGVTSFTLVKEEPLAFSTLRSFIGTLLEHQGSKILRVKGLVKVKGSEGRPVVVHGVQEVMHPPMSLKKWPSADQRTRLVFITKGLSREDVVNTLDAMERSGPWLLP